MRLEAPEDAILRIVIDQPQRSWVQMAVALRQSRHMIITIAVWLLIGLGLALLGHAQESGGADSTPTTVVPAVGPVGRTIPGAPEFSCPAIVRAC